MEKLDILGRDEFVDNLFRLIENISDNKSNCCFALNGAWGCGKSFVLDMLEERLNPIQSEETNTDRYFVIRYNCWKYDYYEEPIVAIVAALLKAIERKINFLNDCEEKSGEGKYIVLRLFLVLLIFHCDGMAGKRRVIAAVIVGIKLIKRLTRFRIKGTGIALIGKAGRIGRNQTVKSAVRCQVHIGAFLLAVICYFIGFVVFRRGVCSCVKKPQPGAVTFSLMQSIVDSVGL